MPDRFANTPEPPYFAVIFTSEHRQPKDGAYEATARTLLQRVQEQPGFIGFEGVSDPAGFEMLVAYFADEAAIRAWREDGKHLEAQRHGKNRWYSQYRVRVARVERSYSGPAGR